MSTTGEDGDDDVDVEDGQNCAFLTLDTLASTPDGVTSPMIVTFFVAKSILNDVTPSIFEICFLTFPSQPLQWIDTLKTTTLSRDLLVEEDFKEGESFDEVTSLGFAL